MSFVRARNQSTSKAANTQHSTNDRSSRCWISQSKEALDVFPQMTSEAFQGSPIETDNKRLCPTPNEFPDFIKRVIAIDLKPCDFGAETLKATKAPMFFIHGDADGVRLNHIAEMFRRQGDEILGDLRPRSASRLAILPNTIHVTLMERKDTIIPIGERFSQCKARVVSLWLQRGARPRESSSTPTGLPVPFRATRRQRYARVVGCWFNHENTENERKQNK